MSIKVNRYAKPCGKRVSARDHWAERLEASISRPQYIRDLSSPAVPALTVGRRRDIAPPWLGSSVRYPFRLPVRPGIFPEGRTGFARHLTAWRSGSCWLA